MLIWSSSDEKYKNVHFHTDECMICLYICSNSGGWGVMGQSAQLSLKPKACCSQSHSTGNKPNINSGREVNKSHVLQRVCVHLPVGADGISRVISGDMELLLSVCLSVRLKLLFTHRATTFNSYSKVDVVHLKLRF